MVEYHQISIRRTCRVASYRNPCITINLERMIQKRLQSFGNWLAFIQPKVKIYIMGEFERKDINGIINV
jgi:hypothetical protein